MESRPKRWVAADEPALMLGKDYEGYIPVDQRECECARLITGEIVVICPEHAAEMRWQHEVFRPSCGDGDGEYQRKMGDRPRPDGDGASQSALDQHQRVDGDPDGNSGAPPRGGASSGAAQSQESGVASGSVWREPAYGSREPVQLLLPF